VFWFVVLLSWFMTLTDVKVFPAMIVRKKLVLHGFAVMMHCFAVPLARPSAEIGTAQKFSVKFLEFSKQAKYLAAYPLFRPAFE